MGGGAGGGAWDCSGGDESSDGADLWTGWRSGMDSSGDCLGGQAAVLLPGCGRCRGCYDGYVMLTAVGLAPMTLDFWSIA